MKKILVSSCLVGLPVRYNGTTMAANAEIIKRWHSEGRLVHACPELSAGFPVPRPPAEIRHGDGGFVLVGSARVFEVTGRDVTDAYLHGARGVLALAKKFDIALAVLSDGSPSCGSTFIYSGDFSGRTKQGRGVTAAMLEDNGIRVFSHMQIAEADAFLNAIK